MTWRNEPAYFAVLRDAAAELLAMHDISPRVVRYVASMQKWLITQAIIALHFERERDEACPQLTAGALIDFFAEQRLFSKNTLTAHVLEMRVYGLLVPRESRDRRIRPLALAAYGEVMIRRWMESHLVALDRLDGGNRAALFESEPRFMAYIHPLAVRSLVFNPHWARPPHSIELFVRTESGSNILHDLICRLPGELPDIGQPLNLGPLRASEVSTRHTLSRGHVQRVFTRAREEGLLVWSLPGNKGDLIVSNNLLQDYSRWQAVKFEAISLGFNKAKEAFIRREQKVVE